MRKFLIAAATIIYVAVGIVGMQPIADAATGQVYTTTKFPINLTATAPVTQVMPACATSGCTMTGALTLAGDPTMSNQAATKNYVDSLAGGLTPVGGVVAGSTANLTATYANGTVGVGATLTNSGANAAFTIDGVSPPSTSRILIKDQTAAAQNGIYTLTTVGDGSTPWVLTRATDYDTAVEMARGSLVSIASGTVNNGASYYQTSVVTTVGTDPVDFSVFFSPSGYLLRTNNLSDVSSPSTSRSNLGLGTAAIQSTGFFNQVANNLSDVANAATARTNLGLEIGVNIPALSGTGAVGDWPINITGTAALNLPLSGGALTGNATNTNRYLFVPTTFVTTMSQSGILATIVGMNSGLAGAKVVPASGSAFTVLTYQGTSTVPTNVSQTISAGTACTVYYFPNGTPLDSVDNNVGPITLFNNIQYLTLGPGSSFRGAYNLSSSNSFTSSGASTIPSNSGNQSASQSATTVTGVGTSWDAGYIGHLYRPSTGAATMITGFTDTTHLTVAASQTVAATGFDVPGKTTTFEATSMDARGNFGTNNLYINGSLIMPDRSTLSTSGGNALTLTTTGTTNATLPLGTITLVPTTGTGATGTWGINVSGNAATVTTNANLTGDITSSGNATTYNGILPMSKGGANASLTASNGGIVYSTASALGVLAAAAGPGQILQSGGASQPFWSVPAYPSLSGAVGKIIRSNGTNNVYTTTTYPDLFSINDIPYASSANTLTSISASANSILAYNGSSVPGATQTLPSAVQNLITAVNSAANTLSIGGGLKTFVAGIVNILSGTAPASFTPGIAFGGGTTGLTYSFQSGRCDTVTVPPSTVMTECWGSIGLSNKGSSTGTATITGFPTTTGSNAAIYIFDVAPENISISTGAQIFADMTASGTTATLRAYTNAAGNTSVTNTNFANNSVVKFYVKYGND